MKRILLLFLLFILWACPNHKAYSQTIERIGFDGSTVSPILLHPTDKDMIYVGTWDPGYIYKSTNGGDSWSSALNSGMNDSRYIWMLAMDEANSNTLYAATAGNSQGTSDLFYRSTNSGSSWVARNSGLPATYLFSWSVGSNGYIMVGTNGAGIRETSNGGGSWNHPVIVPSGVGNFDTGVVHDIRFFGTPPASSGMYVVAAFGMSDGTISIYEAASGNLDWMSPPTGRWDLPQHNGDVYEIIHAADYSNIVYAATGGNGVYKSTDFGNSWNKVNNGLGDLNINDLKMDADGELWAGTAYDGIYRSSNEGDTWMKLSGSIPMSNQIRKIEFSPVESKIAYVSTNHGLFKIDYGTAASYTISGYVRDSGSTGIIGVSMYGLPGNPTTNSSGYYEATVSSGWSGTVTPLKTGYTFTPSYMTYSNVTSDQSNQNYTGTLNTSTISGYVRDAQSQPISGVSMYGLPGDPSTNASGFYTASVSYGWSGTVTPSNTGYTFSPSSRTYSGITSDQSDQDYTGTLELQSISGYVRDDQSNGIPGVSMNGLPGVPVTNSDGYYYDSVSYGWSGTVTPTEPGYTFVPPSRVYSNVINNQSNQDYTGTPQTTPSSITLTQPTGSEVWNVGSDEGITWTSTGTINNVTIELTRDNTGSWETLTGSTANDGSYTWTVTNPVSTDCRIRVSDAGNNTIFDQSDLTFSISTRRVNVLTKPGTQTSGTLQNAYRLFSVPLHLDNQNIGFQLTDDLGQYDIKKWRLFDYQGGDWIEYSSSMEFSPGRSFFLIVAESDKELDVSSGTCIGSWTYDINLDSGYNLVSNPYLYDLSVSDLALGSGGDITLWTYDGSWNTTTNFDPWEGYALHVNSTTTLTVSPDWGSLAKVAPPLRWSEAEWSMRIEAVCDQAKDGMNLLGVHSEAREGLDRYDLYEPPFIGEYVAVYFLKQENGDNGSRFATDFRPPSDTGWSWDLVIETIIPESPVNLNFKDIASLPEGLNVRLTDLTTNRTIDPVSNPRYTFVSDEYKTIRRFKLTTDYQQRPETEDQLPQTCTLYPNFPNPFNSHTTIPFGLSESSRVYLAIYNARGERLRTLLEGEMKNAGDHTVVWNAKDEFGREVPTGMYFCRIRTDTNEGGSSMKKLIYLK